MRLAIPIWNGRVSPVFDTARHVLLVEVEGKRERDRRQEELAEEIPARRARRLTELGVEVLICGGISRSLATLLAAAGIQMVAWTAGPVDEVLAAYLGGRLPDPRWLMPGCAGWPSGSGAPGFTNPAARGGADSEA